ncbi:MAG: thioredoxin [Clostridium beijerinckii]|jgi:thioredoxin 1|uniref:thioredoxin n=1 Tax=Clostridium TaxID=1485 RepID=UPI000B406E8B|nr:MULTISPECIES: thioredoxin [Clostridium]MCI1580897.1 thioredoxin [Clostridium beijerinckii]MCI1584170.1 thioredoxin [Clostridium beijerinckii]MCI1624263.1 thioredoxin [Clostridium beijerinckii]NOW91740.1 thioredoxin 1 [Clostridium beijerinckii]OVE65925.1 thioredoxin [Clostridium diolis]
MKIVDNNEFVNEIKSGVTVVDFFATWCGPCKMISPILEELSEEMREKVNFIKIDVDKSVDLADEYHISSIPTVVIFKNNEKVNQFVGFLPKEEIKRLIENTL